MAATKTARKEPVKRTDRKSVPRSGGRATASTAVAGSNPRRRTAGKVKPSPDTAVPALPARKPTPTAEHPDRHPTVDPAVIAAAHQRAVERGTWQHVRWDARTQSWKVPSLSRSGEYNTVLRNTKIKGPAPFWVALVCNCDAVREGNYMVCYHKSAVYLSWKYEQLVQDAIENGGDIPLEDD